ncbi:MAG: hypothetical protein GC138_04930 [Gammaproteobacteria bacterium]|nr:hypothetical protein [Gammaproteobacteria bacterium]
MTQTVKKGSTQISGPIVEGMLSGIGGFLAIYITHIVAVRFLGEGHILFVTSMGAAAMLMFAVPHSPMAQPWALITGNLVSAAIGVTVARWVPDPTLGAPLAVGGSIIAMQVLRCQHPPGSATALTAVVGGASITNLGYGYLLTPVLLNIVLLLVIAVIFNWPFAWRRYPAVFAESRLAEQARDEDIPISREAIAEALRRHDTYIDVDEHDLEQIYVSAARLERDRSGNGAGEGQDA